MRRRHRYLDPFEYKRTRADYWAEELDGLLREWMQYEPHWLRVEENELLGPRWLIPGTDAAYFRQLVRLSPLALLGAGTLGKQVRFYCRTKGINHATVWMPRLKYVAWVAREGGERVRGVPHDREDMALLHAILALLRAECDRDAPPG